MNNNKRTGRISIKIDMDYVKRLRSLGFGYRGIAEEIRLKDNIRISHATIKNRLDGKYI